MQQEIPLINNARVAACGIILANIIAGHYAAKTGNKNIKYIAVGLPTVGTAYYCRNLEFVGPLPAIPVFIALAIAFGIGKTTVKQIPNITHT